MKPMLLERGASLLARLASRHCLPAGSVNFPSFIANSLHPWSQTKIPVPDLRLPAKISFFISHPHHALSLAVAERRTSAVACGAVAVHGAQTLLAPCLPLADFHIHASPPFATTSSSAHAAASSSPFTTSTPSSAGTHAPVPNSTAAYQSLSPARFASPEKPLPGMIQNTGVKMEVLKELGRMITRLPPDLKVLRALKQVYNARANSVETAKLAMPQVARNCSPPSCLLTQPAQSKDDGLQRVRSRPFMWLSVATRGPASSPSMQSPVPFEARGRALLSTRAGKEQSEADEDSRRRADEEGSRREGEEGRRARQRQRVAEEFARRHRASGAAWSQMLYLTAAATAMLGAAYAAVPLYRMFCQATGFGGTTQRKETVEDKIARHSSHEEEEEDAVAKAAARRELTIHFNADVAEGLPWKFTPTQREVKVRPGESTLAFYTAQNLSDKAITGVSTYNVSPMKAGIYFNKIQCFCFEEQRLQPHEKIDMPVFFYIDPEFAVDPSLRNVNSLTLSYTFFKVDS